MQNDLFGDSDSPSEEVQGSVVQPDYEAAQAYRHEFSRLLNQPSLDQNEWRDEMDAAFLGSLFGYDRENQYVYGPDNKRYYRFQWVENQMIWPAIPGHVLSHMVERACGAVVEDSKGKIVFSYTPGDIVAFKLYGRTTVRWEGKWAELPDVDDYNSHTRIVLGSPNEDMMPPLAARCADYYLSRWMAIQPGMSGRVPGVCVMRSPDKSSEEQATNLVVNIFQDDGEGIENYMRTMLKYVASLLPRHLSKRLLMGHKQDVENYPFKPFREIYESAELKPVES